MSKRSSGDRARGTFLKVLASRALTVFLLYLGVGMGHHLYLEIRFQGDRFLNFDQRDDAAANLARRVRQPDVEALLVDLNVAGRNCTAVPVQGSDLLVTAAHCVVDDAYRVLEAGNMTVDFFENGQLTSEPLPSAEILVHPRYIETAGSAQPDGFQRMLLSALTWATIRGADRAASPYTWDVAVIRTTGRTWTFGVAGVTDDRTGPYLVEAYQNFTADGTPICTLEYQENCPTGTLPSETVEQQRRGVRCSVAEMGRPSQLDGWFPCAIMPGGSGGAVLVLRDGHPYLLGLVTGGDEWGEGNGVTIGAVSSFVTATRRAGD